MKFKIELSGGLELLFNKSKKMEVEIGEKEIVIVQDIINELRTKIIEKPDFFITKDNSIRPGIIVLINDSDWEIFDKENTQLSDGDTLSFISTLHGG